MVDYNQQEEVTLFLQGIEREYAVDTWTLGGIHIWPFVKVSLYFYIFGLRKDTNLISLPECSKPSSRPNQTKGLLHKTLFRITHPLKFKKFLSTLPEKDILFYSHSTYRTLHKGKQFNKFFDTLIEEKFSEQRNQIAFIEDFYNYNPADLAHSDLIVDVRQAFNYFLTTATQRTPPKLEGADYQEFIDHLDEGFALFKSQFSTENFFSFFSTIYYKSLFFEAILKKINPKQLYITCYYCNSSFPLIIAAKKLGIEVIEMQHGVMDTHHIPYGFWTKTPPNGYEMMPDVIWNWDIISAQLIQENFKNTPVKSMVKGNPWVDYLKKEKIEGLDAQYILYSLQPFLENEMLFPPEMIKAINELPYVWYLRLHPRQVLDQPMLIDYLKSQGTNMAKINFDLATEAYLPPLLEHAKLHITQYSSCVIEAALLNKKTWLIYADAQLYFKEYIKTGMAEYVDPDQLFNKLSEIATYD